MNEQYKKRGYLLEDFRLFHLRDAQGTGVDYHYHEFHKLLFLLSGSGGYAVEGRRYLLKPGDAVLIGSHCVHRPEFEPGVPYERIILYISPEFLRRESVGGCDLQALFDGSRGHVLRPDEQLSAQLRSLTDLLEQELAQDRYGRTILSNGLLLRVLVELGRYLHRQPVQLPAPLEPRDGRVLEILRYLDQNLTEEVSIEALAERFYISKYHMMRRFRRETGTTIHAYISERRLLLARDLIGKGMASTEACFRCGFGSYSSFSRAYSKLFGTTPTGRSDQTGVKEETYE